MKLCVAALLAAHVTLVCIGIHETYVTFDEPAHVQSGLSHWQTGTFTMYRVNPPLPRMLATLPVLAAEPATDWKKLEHWRSRPAARAEFRMAEPFVRANGKRLFELVRLARYAGILWSLLGALVVFVWARERFGVGAGLLALGCWCFEPNIVGHAAVCTPDLPATAMTVTVAFALSRYLRRPGWATAFAVGGALGVALLTKLTLLVLLPIAAVLVGHGLVVGLVRVGRRTVAIQLAAAVLAMLVVIHAGYGFRGALPRLGDIPFVSQTFAGRVLGARAEDGAHSGNRFAGTWLSNVLLPLPEDMVRGADVQRRDFEKGLRSYLDGEWRNHGWWHYYLHGLALKVPLGLLGLCALASFVAWRTRRVAPPGAELVLLLPPLAILVFVSSQTGFSHHLRYVLPIFPFAFIHAGRVVPWANEGALPRRALAFGLAACGALAALAAVPRSLSYFNLLAGGSEGGPRHMLDSNIDWGQDLLELRNWLRAHPEVQPIHVAYFGQVIPEVEGIRYEPVPEQPSFSSPEMARWAEGFGPKPGWYAISVSYVYGATYPVGDGRWGRRRVHPDDFAYFRELEPVARAGNSINIYRISEERATALRSELGLPPLTTRSSPLVRR